MKRRIIGIDVARALAIFGMIIVNFKIVFGYQGDGLLKHLAQFCEGKAAATFVVLAGVGLALMTNSAIQNSNKEKLGIAYKRILKRSLFLFVIGLSYISIWPADILHFYGIYMVITLALISRKSNQILVASALIIFLFPLLLFLIDYEAGWNFETLVYIDFWSFSGFFRNLFYNGFHPVIPWTAFMLFGLWFGKQDLQNTAFVKKSFWVSLISFILIQFISYISIHILANGDAQIIQELNPILGTEPMPPMPLYMLNGIAISITTISGCILVANNYEKNFIIDALNKTGQLALTFYVAHVVLGMGVMEGIGTKKLGEYSINFSVIYALAFSLGCILFAVLWLRFKKSGPLEWIIRKVTN